MTKRVVLGAAAIASIGFSAIAAAPASAGTLTVDEHNIDGVTTNVDVDTRGELDAFVTSSKAKEITIDVTTGEIVDVTAVGNSRAAISGPTGTCSSTQMCLHRTATPYRDWGFSGLGTKTGSFTNINKYSTGNASGKIQLQNGVWTSPIGPNSISFLTGSTHAKAVNRY